MIILINREWFGNRRCKNYMSVLFFQNETFMLSILLLLLFLACTVPLLDKSLPNLFSPLSVFLLVIYNPHRMSPVYPNISFRVCRDIDDDFMVPIGSSVEPIDYLLDIRHMGPAQFHFGTAGFWVTSVILIMERISAFPTRFTSLMPRILRSIAHWQTSSVDIC